MKGVDSTGVLSNYSSSLVQEGITPKKKLGIAGESPHEVWRSSLEVEEENRLKCPALNYLQALSELGDSRWFGVGCKRRKCPVCGVRRKNRRQPLGG